MEEQWTPAGHHATSTSGLREITLGSVAGVQDLAPQQGVFLLTFEHGVERHLVIKSELKAPGMQGHEAIYNATAEIMGFIDHGARAEALTQSEVTALKKVFWNQNSQAFNDVLHRPLVGSFFVKMKCRQQFRDLQRPAFTGFTPGQVAVLASIVTQLKGNVRVWETLGEIVVTDLFIGNADRIAPAFDAIAETTDGQATLQNAGNIFFKFDKDGNLKKAVALDNFDSVQTASMLNSRILPDQWKQVFAPILRDDPVSMLFSRSVVEQVVRHADDAGLPVDLGQVERAAFNFGFGRGIQKLQAYVKMKGRNNLPPGVAARVEFLNWSFT
jgi:hypothetical protein